jgi:hypothetical protein
VLGQVLDIHDRHHGAGVGFLESREVALKGIDGSHRLYAVDLT